jgi:hypothetical protein
VPPVNYEKYLLSRCIKLLTDGVAHLSRKAYG